MPPALTISVVMKKAPKSPSFPLERKALDTNMLTHFLRYVLEGGASITAGVSARYKAAGSLIEYLHHKGVRQGCDDRKGTLGLPREGLPHLTAFK